MLPYKNPNLDIEQRLDDLISRMTLDEQIMQTDQFGPSDVMEGEYFGCHPCINTSSLRIRTEDFRDKIIPALKHEPTFVTI